jgi:hypothetical protein
MITEDNIDRFIDAESLLHRMISERLQDAKRIYEKLKDDLEDCEHNLKDLRDLKKSHKN